VTEPGVLVLRAWCTMMAIAALLALAASLPPRRPISVWLGDFLVRWGLAGFLVWLLVWGFWALRELAGIKIGVPFSSIEALAEYALAWGAALTGLATFLFFAAALLLRAVFERPRRRR
jgi:hypothetical protein